MGDKALMQDSPSLFWYKLIYIIIPVILMVTCMFSLPFNLFVVPECRLAVTFLAFEVLFVMFCIGMASIILLIMFCYFPVVATIEYISAIGKGASEDELRTLSKFHYTRNTFSSAEKQDCELAMEPDNEFSTPKLVLHPDDSVRTLLGRGQYIL